MFENAAVRADNASKTPVEHINAAYTHLLDNAINVILCGSLFLLVRQIALNQVRASARSQVLPAKTAPIVLKPPGRTSATTVSQARMGGWSIAIVVIGGLLILGGVLGIVLNGSGNTHRIVETEQSRERSDRAITSPVGAAPTITAAPSPVLSVAQNRNPSASEIAKNTFPSVALVATEDTRGQPLAFGTGFFVDTDVVATNFHVVENAGSAYAKIVGKSSKIPIDGLVGLDAVHDIALLHVRNSAAPLLRIANEDLVAVGDQIFTIGNPRGLEGTFSEGIVSSRRRFGRDELLQITAPISPGSSGGPVLDRTGEVIGVAVASITNGQNLNFAIPATNVKALLDSKTEIRPLTSIPRVKLRSTIFGEQSIRKGAVGENLSFDGVSFQTGEFSFSLHNLMKEPIRNLYGIIIFCDVKGQPIDTYSIYYPSIVPPRLAKRVRGNVDVSVERLNCPVMAFPYVPEPPRPPKGPIEFRILDFEIVNN